MTYLYSDTVPESQQASKGLNYLLSRKNWIFTAAGICGNLQALTLPNTSLPSSLHRDVESFSKSVHFNQRSLVIFKAIIWL